MAYYINRVKRRARKRRSPDINEFNKRIHYIVIGKNYDTVLEDYGSMVIMVITKELEDMLWIGLN